MFYQLLTFLALFVIAAADNMHAGYSIPMSEKDMTLAKMNSTTGGPYTYDISDHHFWGTAFDGSWIDTRSACCGSAGDCRDNPSCVCQYQVGPLPPGTYSLGNMFTYKGMPYCYELYPSASNDMCGRGGFLIHGGDCYSGNPSIGCIVIPDQNTRYMIKSGATLYVQK